MKKEKIVPDAKTVIFTIIASNDIMAQQAAEYIQTAMPEVPIVFDEQPVRRRRGWRLEGVIRQPERAGVAPEKP